MKHTQIFVVLPLLMFAIESNACWERWQCRVDVTGSYYYYGKSFTQEGAVKEAYAECKKHFREPLCAVSYVSCQDLNSNWYDRWHPAYPHQPWLK